MKRKRCCICKHELRLNSFNKRARSNDGLQPHCRGCNKEKSRAYYQRHYEKHKKVVMARSKAVRQEHAMRVFKFLESHPYVDCGETDPVVLEFDHVRGSKSSSICSMLRLGKAWPRVVEEMDKCEVRCANCHRRKTAVERGFYSWRNNAGLWLNSAQSNRLCKK